MYIYIDESGNFVNSQDKYFIVGGFVTSEPKRVAKAFRKWQHSKFPNKLKHKSEVKFTDTGLNEEMRLKTLKYFVKQDIRVFYSFLKIKNIPLEYRKKDKIESGFLYAEIVKQTLQLLVPSSDLEFRIFRDERQLKKVSGAEFNELIKLNLLASLPAKLLVAVKTLDSTTEPNIQIADWVCGALFRYHNKKRNGEQYFSVLKNSIIGSKELFEGYWVNLYKKEN